MGYNLFGADEAIAALARDVEAERGIWASWTSAVRTAPGDEGPGLEDDGNHEP